MHSTSILLITLFSLTTAVLPPGYEEELYCPADKWLKRRTQPPGWAGPRTAFYECCRESDGVVSEPHAWGVKVGMEVKEELIQNGWHLKECETPSPLCMGKTERLVATAFSGLLRRVDRLLTGRVDRLLGGRPVSA